MHILTSAAISLQAQLALYHGNSFGAGCYCRRTTLNQQHLFDSPVCSPVSMAVSVCPFQITSSLPLWNGCHPAYNTELLYGTLSHPCGTFSNGRSPLHMGCKSYSLQCELQMIPGWTVSPFPFVILQYKLKIVLRIFSIY